MSILIFCMSPWIVVYSSLCDSGYCTILAFAFIESFALLYFSRFKNFFFRQNIVMGLAPIMKLMLQTEW